MTTFAERAARPRRSTTRAFHRAKPGLFEGILDEDGPLINAWPGGFRTIACLWCDRPFASSGRQERMCQACRRHTR
jgi:hypothetical protein